MIEIQGWCVPKVFYIFSSKLQKMSHKSNKQTQRVVSEQKIPIHIANRKTAEGAFTVPEINTLDKLTK